MATNSNAMMSGNTAREINDDHVLRMRQEMFDDGIVSASEAEAIFVINQEAEDKSEAWDEFFVEAITDYIVHQAQPQGYVTQENADWLIAQIMGDGVVELQNELELLVKIIEKSNSTPPKLELFALEQVEQAVLEGKGCASRRNGFTKGVLNDPEVELLRRIIFGFGGNNGVAVSRTEADILFNLNDKTSEADNCAAWTEFFVKAIANHLMCGPGYQAVSMKTAAEREAWLDDTDVDPAGMLAKSLRSIGGMFGTGNMGKLMKSDHDAIEEAWAQRNTRYEADGKNASHVTESEAEWLVERIKRDGVIHKNEKALLHFIREDGDKFHDSIRQLIDEAA